MKEKSMLTPADALMNIFIIYFVPLSLAYQQLNRAHTKTLHGISCTYYHMDHGIRTTESSVQNECLRVNFARNQTLSYKYEKSHCYLKIRANTSYIEIFVAVNT